tara:strand:+ start:257 stop:904 length:648 start_codon:yes stop_codon:yes gene_type:complete
MSTAIPEVEENNIKHCLLIEMQIGTTTYYISNSWKAITHNGNVYTQLGSFLSIGEFTEDIKTTNGDLSMVLTGIPAGQVRTVMENPVKGGVVKVSRAFFDDNYAVTTVYPRYNGIITNYNISESVALAQGDITNSVGISVASINTILENRVNGQRTTPEDRTRLFPTDTTFARVPIINNTAFDFGKDFSYGGGYGGGGGGGRNGNPFDFGNFGMR